MSRILICIGVNQYDAVDLDALDGAEADAQNIFDTLTDTKLGGYDPVSSRLLMSPTLMEVRQVLDDLIGLKPVDTVTFFFAGHGGVNAGSYYLCLKNSSLQRLSTTALGMPELLLIISELSPQECNIIIDACEAGGVTIDLGTIIKPEILGAAATPSVSILCSSSANQGAGDTPIGGVGTLEIVKALKGQTLVEENNEYLDLVAVGRVVSSELMGVGGQTPVVWGLNLSGKSRFSKNPHYSASGITPVLADRIPPGSEANEIINAFSERLLLLTLKPAQEILADEVYFLLAEIAQALGSANQETRAPQFVAGFAVSLIERVRLSHDVFAPIEMLAACCAVLNNLPHNTDTIAGQNELCKRLFEELIAVFNWLAIELDDRTLCDGGLADLYLLPIRITRVLGWAAVYLILAESIEGHASPEILDTTRYAVNTILALYPLSFSSVSDEQTPYLAVFMSQAIKLGWIEESELIYGLFFSSFMDVKGQITSPDMPSEKIADYIACRGRNQDYSSVGHEIAQPSEMLSLLLLLAHSLKLEDVTDPYLESIDHLTLNVFLPETYKDFSQEVIPGTNHTYQIGHGIWQVSDFAGHLPTLKSDAFQDVAIRDMQLQVVCMCASFIFPDRCPWFLLLD